jgi:hypothetical protein
LTILRPEASHRIIELHVALIDQMVQTQGCGGFGAGVDNADRIFLPRILPFFIAKSTHQINQTSALAVDRKTRA